MPPSVDALDDGLAAFGDGRWSDAVDILERAVDEATGADRCTALDALADSRWWLGDTRRSILARERAYSARRKAGDTAGAARAAAWIAREHAAALGNVAMARGWLARAQTIAADAQDTRTDGWVNLAAAVLADAAGAQADFATQALRSARSVGDGDLEMLALGRLGLAEVSLGLVSPGLAHLDEAMAMAAVAEAEMPTTTAQLCCDFVLAAELAGEPDRFGRWAETVDRVAALQGTPSPVTFCTTCCAEQAAAQGDLSGAERQLHIAVIEMTETPRAARCIRPAAKLADLLVLQGRLEEAQRAVGDADDAPSLVVRARIAQALGEPAVAATLAERAARREGPQAAAYATLVHARLDAGDVGAAREAVTMLESVVSRGADMRGRAQLALSRGRVALADQDVEGAVTAFEDALDEARGAVCLEAAAARLQLARLRAADRPSVAHIDAKAALSMFETLGATVQADAAAAVLRSLGDRSRVGPKNVGVLSRREEEVLRLVGQGLTNAEIASRLFISTKTAGNHVSAILAKLGARSRTEAAAHLAARPHTP